MSVLHQRAVRFQGCNKGFSVKNFYKTNRIETLAKIPEDEIKEEVVKMEKITDYSVGKYEIYKEDNSFFIRLNP